MQAKYHAFVAAVELLLVVCVAQKGKQTSFNTKRGLNNVGHVLFARRLVEVLHIFARVILVGGKVKVGAVGNSPKFAPAKREQKLKVGCGVGIVRKLLFFVVAKTKIFLFNAKT